MSPKEAYEYAKKYGPSNETREIACKHTEFAYLYALYIHKKPRNNTRKAACEDPEFAYFYTLNVDKSFHEDTWKAVKNTEFEEKYNKFLNQIEKSKII